MTNNEMIDKVIEFEGGYVVHKNVGESEITYAGIYKKANPKWVGWDYIAKGGEPPKDLVRELYFENYLKPIYPLFKDIDSARVKFLLFDFAVNAGVKKAKELFEIVGANGSLSDFGIARISFYAKLAENKKYQPFLRGWINRSLKCLA